MQFLRSLIFRVLFALNSCLFASFGLLCYIFPRSVSQGVADAWSWVTIKLLRIPGIKTKVEGRENLGKHPVIFASKHQSDFETAMLRLVLKKYRVVYVAKKQLLQVPLWGWVLRRTGAIPAKKASSLKDLNGIQKLAEKRIKENHSLIIFPEGMRTKPGQEPKYQAGVGILYSRLLVPVVPIALNSGLFWNKNDFVLKKGTVVIRILPRINPGLKIKDLLHKLESGIEKESNELCGCKAESRAIKPGL